MKVHDVFVSFLFFPCVCLVSGAFKRLMDVDVKSGRNMVQVKINQALTYEVDNNAENSRGLHVVVLNQASGSLMAKEVFDMYEDDAASDDLIHFLKRVLPGRILVFAILDEGSFKFNKEARDFIETFGSQVISKIAWRWSWAMVCFNAPDSMINESFSENALLSTWSKEVHIVANVELKSAEEIACNWPQSDSAQKQRKHFCERYEGYASVCDCHNPIPLVHTTLALPNRNLDHVPTAVIASNRPYYLFRTLQSLMQARGADPRKVVVFIDGYHNMPVEVAKLFGIHSVHHAPVGEGAGRISEHYKNSLKEIFALFSKAKHAIVLEDDLKVSPDFFYYFSQLVPIIEKDNTVYCISAWNDQGYDHTSHDPTMLYRVATMPGLGWLIKKSLFKNELLDRWPTPDQKSHWDMWMRLPDIRQDRECIVPDISRTYHFGVKGFHMYKSFHDQYFANHSLNTQRDVQLKDIEKMTKPLYEVLVIELIKRSIPLDHTKTPCDEDFFPEKKSKKNVYALYIEMDNAQDFTVFKQVAKCLRVWDLDMRGDHKSLWRMFYNGNQLLIVGTPASIYSTLKPKSIIPISFKTKKDEL